MSNLEVPKVITLFEQYSQIRTKYVKKNIKTSQRKILQYIEITYCKTIY